MERRVLSEETEIRIDGEGLIRGHAVVWDKLSVPIMDFREKVKRGAFTKSLEQNKEIVALWNHDSSQPLGRTSAGTLELREDDKGLAFTIEPPDTSFGQDAVKSIRRRDVKQMSFGFIPIKDLWESPKKRGDFHIRTLIEVSLREISPVTFPAYTQTDVKVRHALERAGIDADQFAVALEERNVDAIQQALSGANFEEAQTSDRFFNWIDSVLPRSESANLELNGLKVSLNGIRPEAGSVSASIAETIRSEHNISKGGSEEAGAVESPESESLEERDEEESGEGSSDVVLEKIAQIRRDIDRARQGAKSEDKEEAREKVDT